LRPVDWLRPAGITLAITLCGWYLFRRRLPY
jgi:hypothetical protein